MADLMEISVHTFVNLTYIRLANNMLNITENHVNLRKYKFKFTYLVITLECQSSCEITLTVALKYVKIKVKFKNLVKHKISKDVDKYIALQNRNLRG